MQEAQNAINDMTGLAFSSLLAFNFLPFFLALILSSCQLVMFLPVGKWLGNRQIRCNWATKGAGACSTEDKSNDSQNAVVLTNGSSGIMKLPICQALICETVFAYLFCMYNL